MAQESTFARHQGVGTCWACARGAALCKWEHWDAGVGVLVTALPRMGAQRDARLRHSTGPRFSRVQPAT